MVKLAAHTVDRFQYMLDPEDDDTELLRHLKAENMQRQLAMYASQAEMERNMSRVLEKLEALEKKMA